MRGDITIRVALPSDAARVSALLSTSYAVCFARCYAPEILEVALPLITRANPRLLDSRTYYVAETSTNQIVACGGWSLEHPGSGEIAPALGHIRHFGTHPEWAGRGLGRALVNLSLENARKQGVEALECMSSLVAEGFYRALGFRVIQPIEVQLTPKVNFPAILMRREI